MTSDMYLNFMIFKLCFVFVLKLFVYDFMLQSTLAFSMLPKGERKMAILEIKILYFQSFKIKHEFKKKGEERDE